MAGRLDPFYAVKDKVQASLGDLRASISRAEAIAAGAATDDTARSELEGLLSAARTAMSAIHVDVKDLSQTITIVEENRARFAAIDNRELDSRRAFVTDAKTTLSQCDEQIKRIHTRAHQQQANKRKQLLADSSSTSSRFAASAREEANRANDDFVASSRQSQMFVERQQDEVLLDMSASLDRLKGIGEDINKELIVGGRELDGLGDDLDEAQNLMDTVLKKMDKILKSSDKGRLCLIVILFFTAIALFFGIVYG